MPYPTFSKSGMTTLTFSRGNLFPVPYTDTYGQSVRESESRLVRVATVSPPVTFHSLHFERLPLADFTNLNAWLRHSLIRGSAYTFTYTDTAGTAYTVRWWPWGASAGGENGVFAMPQTSSARYEVDIILRQETAAW